VARATKHTQQVDEFLKTRNWPQSQARERRIVGRLRTLFSASSRKRCAPSTTHAHRSTDRDGGYPVPSSAGPARSRRMAQHAARAWPLAPVGERRQAAGAFISSGPNAEDRRGALNVNPFDGERRGIRRSPHLWSEFLNALAAVFRDVNVSLRINRNAVRLIEPARQVAGAPESRQVSERCRRAKSSAKKGWTRTVATKRSGRS